MKILIFPDIHGRDFWIEPSKHIDEFDKVIFLGDYHDPYPDQVSEELSLERLPLLLSFIEEHKDKVIALLGNHDLNYLDTPTSNRFDYLNQDEVRDILQKMNLQLAFKIDNYLFSHSGVLEFWLSSNQITLDDVLNNNVSYVKLSQVSPYRGGYNRCGSCVWGDINEYANSAKIPDLYQIFGHTQLRKELITGEFACLDCREAFVLDTETKNLIKYNEYGAK